MTGLVFNHLIELTTPLGLFEHANGTEPRPEHAYCLDDVARALVVTVRVESPSSYVAALRKGYLDFVLDAVDMGGRMHNRRNLAGLWTDEASTGDHWGRALLALGLAAGVTDDKVFAKRALDGATRCLVGRSSWPRSMAYAALGAGHVIEVAPEHDGARRLIEFTAAELNRPGTAPFWPWPESRLTYANAVLPQAMLRVGDLVGDLRLRDRGLRLLTWLVAEQTRGGHLSVVSSVGRSSSDAGPKFPQQPIEIAALAEAARTAYLSTRDPQWLDLGARCVAWFAGENDLGVPMADPTTGAGFDGLEASGASLNQGAESTLAWLATVQLAPQPALLAGG